MPVLFLVQCVCTPAMTGLIWFVQVVHYPLFARVGAGEFPRYEAEHARRTGWVVGPLMGAELVSSLLMQLPRFRPAAVGAASAWVGAGLVAVIWLSTGLVQVPLHNRLGSGCDLRVVGRLVTTNWLRTAAWTVRSALVVSWLARMR